MIPSQSGAKKSAATNGQGIVADAGHNQLFLPLTPEKAAAVALGLNVRAPNQHSPEFVIAHLTQNQQPPNRYQLMCLCWYCTHFEIYMQPFHSCYFCRFSLYTMVQ